MKKSISKKTMKKGTLRCKLLGHKFVENRWVTHPRAEYYRQGNYQNVLIDYCVRCGEKETRTEQKGTITYKEVLSSGTTRPLRNED